MLVKSYIHLRYSNTKHTLALTTSVSVGSRGRDETKRHDRARFAHACAQGCVSKTGARARARRKISACVRMLSPPLNVDRAGILKITCFSRTLFNKWKNHFYEMKGDVGMSLHEK